MSDSSNTALPVATRGLFSGTAAALRLSEAFVPFRGAMVWLLFVAFASSAALGEVLGGHVVAAPVVVLTPSGVT